MPSTNVYKGSYDDLSELTVNADSIKSAIDELALIRGDREPTILRKTISGIQIPDPPEPIPVAVIFCRAEREEEGEVLPDTVTVRPYAAIERTPGSTVMLYAIDTAADPTVEFTGWYNEEGLRISKEPSFAFTVPDIATSGQTILLTAKFKAKVAPSVFTVTVNTAMLDGSVVPESCVARPVSIQCNEGESVHLYAITTDADHAFVAWKDSEGTVLSTDSTYVYTPTANTVVTAVFEGV